MSPLSVVVLGIFVIFALPIVCGLLAGLITLVWYLLKGGE